MGMNFFKRLNEILNPVRCNLDRLKASAELEAAYKELKAAKDIADRDYASQAVLNKLLHLSLQPISLDEMLWQFIEQITTIPWLAFEKGAIFLVEDEPGVLVMKAQIGLAVPLLDICARVPFGRCLCGRAAKQGKILFTDRVDERHENKFDGMPEHGHYCVPVISASNKLLGVIVLYTRPGWHNDKREEEFLTAMADVLAGVIERKRTDESLKAAYSALQEAQDQLIQSEKLSAVGQLASGVAHEVRNPLAIILQGVNYLEASLPVKGDDISEVLGMLNDSVKRADRIIAALLDFSRVTKLNLQPEDAGAIVDRSLILVRNIFKFDNIEIISEVKPDIPKVLVDRGRIEQVFINILLNAGQAIAEGGKITIRIYDRQWDEIKDAVGAAEEGCFEYGEKVVIVEFEDTGSGISEEHMKKIFVPFFTTKGPRGGTGLGLSVSRSILNMHKGLMRVESIPGKGMKVSVILKAVRG